MSFFENALESPKVVIVDNPGCNECGSIKIKKITEEAKRMSSSFILVTNVGNYNSNDSCELLRKLYQDNERKLVFPLIKQ